MSKQQFHLLRRNVQIAMIRNNHNFFCHNFFFKIYNFFLGVFPTSFLHRNQSRFPPRKHVRFPYGKLNFPLWNLCSLMYQGIRQGSLCRKTIPVLNVAIGQRSFKLVNSKGPLRRLVRLLAGGPCLVRTEGTITVVLYKHIPAL